MNKKKIVFGLAVIAFSGLVMSQAAFADGGLYGRRNEIRYERRDRRNDWRELRHDRAKLRREFHHDASVGDIARERAEIRHDRQDLARDRWNRWDDRDGDRDDGYRYRPYRRGWYDRFGWWRPYRR